ncbi:MAG: glycoside hydrolase, partial [Ignavibacteria bacterium]|nr:glycoside hydrolase [Ignavibacteria bacterium]
MFSRYLLIILLALSISEVKAQDWQRLVSLKGFWKFSIGDDMNRAKPSYDDKDWETVTAPSSWENEGFNGYDGHAWYRK